MKDPRFSNALVLFGLYGNKKARPLIDRASKQNCRILVYADKTHEFESFCGICGKW